MVTNPRQQPYIKIMQKYLLKSNVLIKYQIFVLNFNIPKTKWEGAEDPTINNFLKLKAENFEYAL